MAEKRGLWINIEGVDCTGKGEQSKRLHNFFVDQCEDNTVLTTHEPTIRAKEIKKKLTEEKDAYSEREKMSSLYIEDRKMHEEEEIIPVYNFGGIVTTNRHKFSTDAYQSAQGIDLNKTMKMQEEKGIHTPDLTLILDITIETLRKRMENTRKINPLKYNDKFESNLEFQGKVIEQYRKIFRMQDSNPEYFGRIELIDANQDIDKVADSIRKVVEPIYKNWDLERRTDN